MNTIIIQGSEYTFGEKTYNITNNVSFTSKIVRFNRNKEAIVLVLLKSLRVNINNKVENFKTIDNKLKIKNYLQNVENVELINNISQDINNKLYYRFIVDSEAARVALESTNNLSESGRHIDISQLNQNCIITPNTFIENFINVPIFHRNGSEKNSKSEIICHFRIVIDILMKVYPQFKHKILELSDLILNLTELKDGDLELYMNKTKSDLIKLLQEKDKELSNKDKTIEETKKERDSILEELRQFRKESNETITNLNNKIDNQTSTITNLNNKIDNQSRILIDVTERLDKLVDHILKLDTHLTSNSIYRYRIILYTTNDNSNKNLNDVIRIKSFVGLIENSPNSDNYNILLDKEVSCSLDNFKVALKEIDMYVINIKYRTIYVLYKDLDDFITIFKAKLLEINKPLKSLQKKVNKLTKQVTELNECITNLEEFIKNKYNLSDNKYKLIVEGRFEIKLYNRYRTVKIDETLGKLYVNYGPKNSLTCYLTNEDI